MNSKKFMKPKAEIYLDSLKDNTQESCKSEGTKT